MQQNIGDLLLQPLFLLGLPKQRLGFLGVTPLPLWSRRDFSFKFPTTIVYSATKVMTILWLGFLFSIFFYKKKQVRILD